MSKTLEHLQAQYGPQYRWRVLFTVLLGMIAAVISSTIVNVGVPDMSRSFELGQERAQWVATGFMAPMTLALSLTPTLLQRFGLRRTYAGSLLVLLCGGILGGVSPTYELMIMGRVLEGTAAGVLQPIPSIVILRAFQPHEQGRAMGLFGFGLVLAPAIGPSVGGLLVEIFGWRSMFFFVVPFCIAALIATNRYLPWHSSFIEPPKPFDWIGMVLLAISTVLLLNGLVDLQHPEGVGRAALMLGTGIVGLAVFLIYQSRREHPLLRVGLFRHRQFAAGVLVSFVYGMGLFGSTYLLPIFLQMALGYSPSAAGLVLLPAGLALAATMPIAGRLADRTPPAYTVIVGLSAFSLSLAMLGSVGIATAYAVLLAWTIVGRIGLGLTMPGLQIGTTRGLPITEISHGTSLNLFCRQLGGALGISLVGIVLESRIRALGLASTATGTATLPAFRITFWVLAAICAVSVVAALRMRLPPERPGQ
ncbi:MAG: DHA2 family efflux MFS transporter permease subunit [Burkholderiales bacterium]|nr:DHA2 family efflux MFS transporter permease subunit [Burkholderiales bacterium]